MIKHTLVSSLALLASCAVPARAFYVALQTAPFFGGAAFTISLGGLIGLPGPIGGLLGLLVLQVVAYLVAFILLQVWLAWFPL